jgi:hypothetical protein
MITDLRPYRKYVDCFDISERQKLELVNTLWVLAQNILDEQFGLNQIEFPTLKQELAPSNQTGKIEGES